MSLDAHIQALVDQRVDERLAELTAAEPVIDAGRLPEVMTGAQVAEALGCSRQHVTTLGRTGALRRKEDGNRYLYLREWVLDYIRSDRSAPAMERSVRQKLANRKRTPTAARQPQP